MTSYTKFELGKLEEIGKNYENGKAFLHNALDLTSCEISVSSMLAGTKLPFNHKHKQNEEIYIFLKGEGTMILNNKSLNFDEGTCIKISPTINRTIEAKTDIQYVCIQAKSNSLEQFGFDDAELC